MTTEHKEPQHNDAEEQPTAAEPAQEAAEATYEAEASETPPSQVDAELEQLKRQLEESQQRSLRIQADFDNFRRRTLKEKEEFAKYASQKLVEQLLPVVDNFERALATARGSSDYEALTKGVDMIFRQFDQVLAGEGLQRMESVGAPFNPEFHQAIMQVESEEHEEGIVVEEIQKGYLLKEKVLRPAMVKVSS